MIQVYSPGNEDFTKNGDCTLLPETASVHAVLSGAWSAELVHPIDVEGRWRYLVEEAVIKMPSFNGDQLFRIRKPEKSDMGVVCTMEPIFYDARNVFLDDVRPTAMTGQEALNYLCTGTPFPEYPTSFSAVRHTTNIKTCSKLCLAMKITRL